MKLKIRIALRLWRWGWYSMACKVYPEIGWYIVWLNNQIKKGDRL